MNFKFMRIIKLKNLVHWRKKIKKNKNKILIESNKWISKKMNIKL